MDPGKEEQVAIVEDVEFLSRKDERAIVRRIDFGLLTSTIVLTFCYVDRALLPYANIAGMAKQLHLQVGNRYICGLKVVSDFTTDGILNRH